jgi:hypothetical protein
MINLQGGPNNSQLSTWGAGSKQEYVLSNLVPMDYIGVFHPFIDKTSNIKFLKVYFVINMRKYFVSEAIPGIDHVVIVINIFIIRTNFF